MSIRGAGSGGVTAARRRSVAVLAAVGAISVVLVVVGLSGLAVVRAGDSASLTDLNGAAVQLDPGATPAAGSSAVPDIGQRLVVASVGLDVPLGAMNAVDAQITPPTFTSAYLVRNMGVSIADRKSGTVFVVTHSLRHGGVAPGNYLIDVEAQTSRVKRGDQVSLAGVTYVVTGWRLIDKPAIHRTSRVWAAVPGRLQLITCLQHSDGTASTQNLVITATLAG
jgi:hypothetical protein